MPSDLEADFPEPEVQRQVKITGDADFCQHREMLELPETEEPAAAAEGDENFCRGREVLVLPGAGESAPEADSDLLAYAVSTSLQVTEERHVYLLVEEAPVIRLEERPYEWEVDSNGGYEAEGEARGLSSPAQTSEMEQRVEAFLSVATPDIPALFLKPACDLCCRRGLGAKETLRYLEEYGAEYLRMEQAEEDYRVRREQAKVWR
jgi:hypothetical protein